MAQGGTAAVDLAGAAAEADRAGAAADHPHVHFDTASLKEEFDSDSSVTYKRSGDTIVVSLGFLQINHRYSIDLKLPASIFGQQFDSLTLSQFTPEVSTVPNLNCRITEFSGIRDDASDFFEMKIEFFAYKEKLLREILTIQNAKNSEEIFKLLIAARVLGKGKGTPMLRTGIHCIGSEKDDDESEASDFSGFGKGKLK